MPKASKAPLKVASPAHTGWEIVETAPLDGSVIIVWAVLRVSPNRTKPGILADAKGFSALAFFDQAHGWCGIDPCNGAYFLVTPTHWLPSGPPERP